MHNSFAYLVRFVIKQLAKWLTMDWTIDVRFHARLLYAGQPDLLSSVTEGCFPGDKYRHSPLSNA
jgi:hypothetical protein